METMNDLILHFTQDVYYAEKLIVRSLAKIGKSVENEALKQALADHRTQTQSQVERLTAVFDALGKRPRAKTCAAMDGLVEEAAEAVESMEPGPVLDSALLACVQAIEHYEIARYGALAAWARAAELEEAVPVLEEILAEEKAADGTLNRIALDMLNLDVVEQEAPKPLRKPRAKRAA